MSPKPSSSYFYMSLTCVFIMLVMNCVSTMAYCLDEGSDYEAASWCYAIAS